MNWFSWWWCSCRERYPQNFSIEVLRTWGKQLIVVSVKWTSKGCHCHQSGQIIQHFWILPLTIMEISLPRLLTVLFWRKTSQYYRCSSTKVYASHRNVIQISIWGWTGSWTLWDHKNSVTFYFIQVTFKDPDYALDRAEMSFLCFFFLACTTIHSIISRVKENTTTWSILFILWRS